MTATITDPEHAIDALSTLLDIIAPGTGTQLHTIWDGLRQSIYHQTGLALAATSGATTEYDYYLPAPTGGNQ